MEHGVGGEVFVIKTSDRVDGVRQLLSQFDLGDYAGQRVVVKANFNSADPFPASTHLDTLQALVTELYNATARDIVLAERSGAGNTRRVLKRMRVLDLATRLGFHVINLEDEPRNRWKKIAKTGTHWLRGFYLAKIVLEAEKVVQTCCLKTHRFGGHFTISLKNSVGLVASRLPGGWYNYMWELHALPHQRLKIAEINRFYSVDLVVLDALSCFINKGPMDGDLVHPQLLLASRDRVAIDAVGVAILRSYGSTRNVMHGKIFELDQIRRAVELGIGVSSVDDIRLVPVNSAACDAVQTIETTLTR